MGRLIMSTFPLLTQASSLADAAQKEMDQKLERSNGELDIVNKWLDEAQGKLFVNVCDRSLSGTYTPGLYVDHSMCGFFSCRC